MAPHTRRLRRTTALGMSIAVVAATLTGIGALGAEAASYPAPSLGVPVPGGPASALGAGDTPLSSTTAPTTDSPTLAAATFAVATPASATSAPVTIVGSSGAPSVTTAGAWAAVGATGISIAPATTIAADTPQASIAAPAGDPAQAVQPVQSLSATITDQQTATAHGFTGPVLELTRTDDNDNAAPVAVLIPNGLLDGLYGSDFASRTRWVEVAVDAATGDQTAQTPVGTLADTTDDAIVLTPTVTKRPIFLAPLTTPISSAGTGSFSATPLKPSSSWDVSAQTGDFSWSYPMAVPPAAAGPAPSVNLTYDSQSVDGETGSSNNQPSAIGDGWSLGGSGFIERTYVSCAQDDGASGPVTTSGDLCWKTDNATLSLGGHTGQLVKDATTGVWKLQSDDGSRIEHLVGTAAGCSANGTYDTDCWRLTTRDGTQYYFGLNELPGFTAGRPAANSTWTVPVFGNDAGEPCHAATFTASACAQAWRWNLDYVVDVHNNAEALYYNAETNKYAQSGTSSASYIRGGQLDHIDYGLTANNIYATNDASDRVTFGYDQYGRCSDTTHVSCTTEPITGAATAPAHPTFYPDVPFDQYCTGTSCPNLVSPTFWTNGMLDTITTQALTGGSYQKVNVWTLGHSFPAPGDGTNAALWLTQIAHTGYSGGASLSEPTTTFAGTSMQNRVWVIDGLAPLYKWRISAITTSTGAAIGVNYSAQQCTPAGAAAIEAAPQSNTSRCFPQWWTPQVTPPSATKEDLFHKYVVTSVLADPRTGGGYDRPQETDYVYTGTPAWRYDTSPLTPDTHKTWSQYAGYSSVEIRVGNTATDYTFYQGMDGDRADTTGGTKSVNVTGGSVKDSLWFAGTTRETKVLNGVGGAVVSDTVNTPWASGVTANDGTVAARMTGEQESVVTEPLSTGGNRTTDTTTSYDGMYGLPLTVSTVPSDASSSCTTTGYSPVNTTAWLIGLPDETAKVGVACPDVPSATYSAAAISDTRTSYDNQAFGAAPTKGDATQTDAVSSYAGTSAATAVWSTSGKTSYDTMGRATSSTDILGHTTSTSYTPAAGAPAGSGATTATATTNPVGWTTTETLNPAWGAETSATDQNGNVTTATYDALGRRAAVWLPGWPQADNPSGPSISYAYTLSQTSPNAVATTTITANSPVEQYILYDGLGRPVQTQASTYGGTLISDTAYDPAGRVYMKNNPYWETSSAASATLFAPYSESEIASEILTQYDGAGRTTATILDQNVKERYRTTTSYPGADRVDVVPPAGGTPTSTFTNALGQKTKLVQHQSAGISGTQQATTYTYDPQGNMASMSDPAGNKWSWAFDALGHQIKAVDPDAGTTTSTYDLAGNQLTSTDNPGITLAYTYDTLNRRTGQYQGAAGTAGIQLATWAYDTAPGGKGQLASSASYTGSTTGHPGLAYTDTVTGYDGLYDPAGDTITIPTGATAFGGTSYTTGMDYYVDGALADKTYPKVGGIADELLQFTYDSLGKLTGSWGIDDYAGVYYNALGQVSQYEKSGTTTDFTGYGYDDANGQIANIADDTMTRGVDTMQAQRIYTHDNGGNVTSVSTSGSAKTDTQCYSYDSLQNLTGAWTPVSNSCATAPSSTALGGPAPYWKSYTVDPGTGNRTTATTHAVTGVSSQIADSYAYPAAGAANPHAVQSISHAAATTTTDTYTYDHDTTTRSGQTLTYGPTGKIATLTIGGKTQTDVYDASGALLLQSDPTNGSTLYLPDTQIHQGPGTTEISAVRTYTLNGTPVAERTTAAGSSTSAICWISNDIDGTPDLETNATTGAVTHRYEDPYGNTRGSAVPWSSQNGYLDKPTSSFSSLTQVGARAYDPAIGKFLSVDSVLSPFNPAQNNGYGYAQNSPITLSDPSGNKPLGTFDNSWQGDTNQSGQGMSIPGAHASGQGAPSAAGNTGHVSYGSSTAVPNASGQTCTAGLTGVCGAKKTATAQQLQAARDNATQVIHGLLLVAIAIAAVCTLSTAGVCSAAEAAAVTAGGAVGAGSATAPLALEAATEVDPWGGSTLSRVTNTDENMFRVWGDRAGQSGEWLSPIEPSSASAARQGLALPPANGAQFFSRVTVPAGTRIQVGPAGAAFGQPGGWPQVRLLERIGIENFQDGVPLGR
ncbi:MAG: hypothetical protein JWQ19_30 [Subtercola sp.]|nr:hypothetical protein [Subtercola sp.]